MSDDGRTLPTLTMWFPTFYIDYVVLDLYFDFVVPDLLH